MENEVTEEKKHIFGAYKCRQCADINFKKKKSKNENENLANNTYIYRN